MTDTSQILTALKAEQTETGAAEHGINTEEYERLISRRQHLKASDEDRPALNMQP